MDPQVSLWEDRMRRLQALIIKLVKPGEIMVPRQLILTFPSTLKVNDLIKARRDEAMDMSMQRYHADVYLLV